MSPVSMVLLLVLFPIILSPINLCLSFSHSLDIKIMETSQSKSLVHPSPGQVFYVEVDIGNPPSTTKISFDTTSPVTWVQIPECKQCFPVLGNSVFHPKNSTTFQPLLPKDPICVGPVAEPSRSGKSCLYNLAYTSGFLGRDLFRFSNSSSSSLVFGCGVYNRIQIGGARPDNPISGMIGLATGHRISIFYQMRSFTRSRFSYCLPGLPAHSRSPVNGSGGPTLDFGSRAVLQGADVQTTSLYREGGMGYMYYLNLTGISLNQKMVVDLRRFNGKRKSPIHFVLDSVSPNTLMTQRTYGGLSRAVISYFKNKYGWVPLEQTMSGYDLCFELAAADVAVTIAYPKIKLHMEGGASFNLLRLFQKFPEFGELCLIIIRKIDTVGDQPSILGTLQQMSYRLLYDVAASKFSFAPNRC